MPKPFDATTKSLIEAFPRDWLALAGLAPTPGAAIELISADLATVTAEADTVIRVNEPRAWLAHVEFQTGHDATLPTRLHRYNALLDERHGLPVRSVAVLLHPRANSPDLTGEYRRGLPGQPDHLIFRYTVVRVWQQPVEGLLVGGPGTLPLAPLANPANLPPEEVVQALRERIGRDLTAEAGLLWSCVAILMGLRYPADRINAMLGGVREMEESSYYQYIKSLGRSEGQIRGWTEGQTQGIIEGRLLGLTEGLVEGQARGLAEGQARGLAEGQARGLAEGRLSEVRRLVIRQGERRFGPIPADRREAIAAATDADRLEGWLDQILDLGTASWPEFGVPTV